MQWIDSHPVGLVRSGIVMAVWGFLLLVAGIATQWVSLPYPGVFLGMWGIVTIAGLAVQAMCELEHQPLNFYVWVGAVALGWAFTLYVVYVNSDLFPEIAPAWLLLLAIGYAHTATKINTRFWALAAIHLVAALIFELQGRSILTLDFIANYYGLIFGVVAGVSMLVASYFARHRVA